MKVIKVRDDVEGAKEAYKIFEEEMNKNSKVFGLATGSTPVTLYKELVNSDIDFSNKISVNLDEYYGLAADQPQSYHYYMNEHLFSKKPFEHSYLPDGSNLDDKAETARYNKVLDDNPVDLQILGIGRNGHIGFNEPGSSFDEKTRKVALTESTINANKIYFDKEEDVPRYAYSMGIGSIMKSKRIILMAYGDKKADAIAKMIEGPQTNDVPATALQSHDDVTVIIDTDAASKLTK